MLESRAKAPWLEGFRGAIRESDNRRNSLGYLRLSPKRPQHVEPPRSIFMTIRRGNLSVRRANIPVRRAAHRHNQPAADEIAAGQGPAEFPSTNLRKFAGQSCRLPIWQRLRPTGTSEQIPYQCSHVRCLAPMPPRGNRQVSHRGTEQAGSKYALPLLCQAE